MSVSTLLARTAVEIPDNSKGLEWTSAKAFSSNQLRCSVRR